VLRSLLEDFLKQEQVKRGYQVVTPHPVGGAIQNLRALAKYKEDLFPMMGESEDEGFVLKAMVSLPRSNL